MIKGSSIMGSNHQLRVFSTLAIYWGTIEMVRQPSSVSSHDYAASLITCFVCWLDCFSYHMQHPDRAIKLSLWDYV
jgi:hypothetical protein